MQSEPRIAPAPDRPAINDCWNKIGVRGDASCPELLKYIHCRNCPVYSAAAVELLNGSLPPDYLEEWTRHFAREKPIADEDTHSALIFRIGAEWFALSTRALNEVSEVKTVHSLPHRRNKIILGLVNIRGELLVCVSLTETLGLLNSAAPEPKTERASHPYLLVISHEGSRLAFPVDEVSGIHRYSAKSVQDAPSTVAGALSTHTKGILPWQGKSVGCLDDQLLFHTLNNNLS